MKKIFISEIKLDFQTRCGMTEDVIADYAEAMKNGVEFPPVTVFRDQSGALYLADGYHRLAAQKCNGETTILADVRNGSRVDALKFALGANAAHGLRRTNADKQNALHMAWENRRELFGPNDPTADWLAKTCGLSIVTAKRFYCEICINDTDLTPKRQNAAGRTYAVPTRPPMRRPAPVRPAPVRPPVKKGYHIGADGKQHADGVSLDRFNVEIPDRIAAAFTTGTDALKNLATTISQARKKSKEVGLQRCTIQLDAAYAEAKAAIPFCVCRACQGNGCLACRDTGFQTEDQYNRNPPELKEKRS